MPARSPLADLDPNDRKRFYDTTLGFMFVAATALIGRTVGDALFLEVYSASDLAYMYPATAITVCSVAYGYARMASRWPLGRLVSAVALFLACLCLALRAALSLPNDEIPRIAAYLLGDLVVNLPMILFWSFAAQCFAPGQAKRLFGLVGAGGTSACIAAGFVVRPISDAFGTPSLLILIAALMVGFALVIRRISKRDGIGRQAPDAGSGEAGIGNFGSLLSQSQIQAIVGLMLAATVVLTLVDYQFKAGARLNVAPEELASFFGTFYGVASVASLFIQLFLVHRVLQKGGVFAGLVVMPVALVVASAVTWITQAFGWTVATKFAVQIFAFTIDSAALQMLYLGIARQTRSQSRALAEGIGKPLATGLTGLALIVGARTSALHELALIAALVSLVWAVLTRFNHNTYIRSLAESLESKRFDASQEIAAVHDSGIENHIRESLTSANDEEIVYLLGILPTIEDVDWSNEYRSMLERDDPRIKIAALGYLREHGLDEDIPAITDLLAHQEPTVRESAIDALQAVGSSEHLPLIEQSLEDADPEVRAAAIAALINSQDLDQLLTAGAELKVMLSDTAPATRIAAAHALGRLERGGLVRPLIGLLQDEETDVLVAALEACLLKKDPKLIPAITPLLANPKVATLAGDALAEFGTMSLDHLIPYIELSETEGAFAGGQGIPPILARIGEPSVLPALEKAAASPDPAMRSNAIRAFAQLLTELELVKDRRDEVEALTVLELQSCRLARSRAQSLGNEGVYNLIHQALTQGAEKHLGNAFVLLDALVPSVRMVPLQQSLNREADARNNAIEVLENVLKSALRDEVMTTLQADTDIATESTSSDILSSILSEGCANWVRIGALYAQGRLEDASAEPLSDNLGHTHPVVRETSLDGLSIVDPERASHCAENLVDDDADIVRDVAHSILHPEAA
jgi:HEAT repeat protein